MFANDVRMRIDDENAGNGGLVNLDDQQNQEENEEQAPVQNNMADVLAGQQNQEPFGANNNPIIPAVVAEPRNNQRIHPRRIPNFPLQQVNNQQIHFGNNRGHGFPLGQVQDHIPRGNAFGSAAMGANQNNRREQEFDHIQSNNAGMIERNERPLEFNQRQRQIQHVNDHSKDILFQNKLFY